MVRAIQPANPRLPKTGFYRLFVLKSYTNMGVYTPKERMVVMSGDVPVRLSSSRLREVFIKSGADDVGFVEIGRPGLEECRESITELFPSTRSLASVVMALNRPNLLAPSRNLVGYEIHAVEDALGSLQRQVLKELRKEGVTGLALPAAFPMDLNKRNRKKMWGVSHKIVAEQSGMGLMGLSRLVLHPELGSAIWLGSMLLDCEVDSYGSQAADTQCTNCRLCVAACPVGAIKPDGSFDFSACLNHNYRELVNGFLDWVDALVTSEDMAQYRLRFNDLETLSWWQSLAYKPGYKCNHCMAVCPAGSATAAEYNRDPKGYLARVVSPLVERPEPVYALPGSDAEKAVLKNKAKTLRPIFITR